MYSIASKKKNMTNDLWAGCSMRKKSDFDRKTILNYMVHMKPIHPIIHHKHMILSQTLKVNIMFRSQYICSIESGKNRVERNARVSPIDSSRLGRFIVSHCVDMSRKFYMDFKWSHLGKYCVIYFDKVSRSCNNNSEENFQSTDWWLFKFRKRNSEIRKLASDFIH